MTELELHRLANELATVTGHVRAAARLDDEIEGPLWKLAERLDAAAKTFFDEAKNEIGSQLQ